MKRILILISVIFAFLLSNAQTTIKTCTTDTINLVGSNLKAGTLEWEKSYNNIDWIKIPEFKLQKTSIYQCSQGYHRVDARRLCRFNQNIS